MAALRAKLSADTIVANGAGNYSGCRAPFLALWNRTAA
jgi:hypothetical protein